jgi:hypothetical protein
MNNKFKTRVCKMHHIRNTANCGCGYFNIHVFPLHKLHNDNGISNYNGEQLKEII